MFVDGDDIECDTTDSEDSDMDDQTKEKYRL
jgi:hypothetical protein